MIAVCATLNVSNERYPESNFTRRLMTFACQFMSCDKWCNKRSGKNLPFKLFQSVMNFEKYYYLRMRDITLRATSPEDWLHLFVSLCLVTNGATTEAERNLPFKFFQSVKNFEQKSCFENEGLPWEQLHQKITLVNSCLVTWCHKHCFSSSSKVWWTLKKKLLL